MREIILGQGRSKYIDPVLASLTPGDWSLCPVVQACVSPPSEDWDWIEALSCIGSFSSFLFRFVLLSPSLSLQHALANPLQFSLQSSPIQSSTPVLLSPVPSSLNSASSNCFKPSPGLSSPIQSSPVLSSPVQSNRIWASPNQSQVQAENEGKENRWKRQPKTTSLVQFQLSCSHPPRRTGLSVQS